ncbi:two-component sensor histidine kinase [Curtobacterium sp. BH-2-1-1]|uniref:sensor histidine kinase n=1 Tax=Curtobacterium sp. BH-2-1-1 TaxID=1905847 RepID=UPI00089DFDD6|nr:HAMP domain-containing sensor histidine kinase [Curtobacterium sp. BH-2-1-1]AOX67713.1 two-component sensor histidine kinase [Curtobacterium sp. BH-2-1-1]
MRTVRMRLTLTYSAVLFGISALALTAVYVALSKTVSAEPLNPVTVKKFYTAADGTIVYKPGEQFQVADLASVQRAVNYASLQTLQQASIVAIAVMFVLSLGIGWWVAGRALRPIGAITRATQEITATDLTRRIDASGPRDELRTLADTVDGMLDRLDRAFRAERMLVEDVSHELRNPVAVVQSNVEAVLASDDVTPAERRAASEVVLQSTRRMTRLLEDLLATARTRSEAFTDRDVDLAALGRSVAAEYRVLAAQRDLTVTERMHGGPVVFADPDALARAVGNLLSNAVRLAPVGSDVTAAVGSVRGWAWVAVADEGPGIPEDERARVFDRFHRGDPDRAGHGSGLGLAIARQIVESHEGRIRLEPHAAGGSAFVLWLPERAVEGAPERTAEPPSGSPLVGPGRMGA